ncbi:MAG: ROK family protein [Nitrosopumilus sp. (ex Thoosa mismalolli)]|nr:ROK family protein [Nitrosopumilus sp. (ex Thoosa mismalolli)]
MNRVGVDLGGTKIEAILLDENLNTLERKRIPTPKNNYEEIVSSITNLVSEITSDVSDFTFGICTPGAISKQTGVIKNSNTQCLIGKSIQNDLESRLGINVFQENDANCFTIAEATMGSATNHSIVFGVIMGTGVGGGIVIDKKIHAGRNLIAGEWGHHILHPNGNSCYCGKLGCVETYLSGPALESRWTSLSNQPIQLPEILTKLDSNIGIQWKTELLENFGVALANVIDILDPDAIVLGGGLSNIDFLYSSGKENVYEKVFSDQIDTPILRNTLGDSAGVFGAALLP